MTCCSPSQTLTLTSQTPETHSKHALLPSSPTNIIKHLQDRPVLLLGFLFVISKAPCPLSHTGFYCLGKRNLTIFQQYSNYNLGGVYTGRRSLAPEQIWFQTAYLHPPETDENCNCLRVFILHCLAWVEAYVSLPHQWIFVRNFSFLNLLSTAPMVQVKLSHPPLLCSMRGGTKGAQMLPWRAVER